MELTGYECPVCHDVVYSRAVHDCRSCTCGTIYVDGGFDYVRLGFDKVSPKPVKLNILTTPRELYNDWNYFHDHFGLIKKGDKNVD